MIKRSAKIVLPLSITTCFELVKKLGNETKGLEEDHMDEKGIFWTAPNYAFDVWITAISDDKTAIEIIASSNGFFDPLGMLEQKTKIFAVRLRNKAKSSSRFKLRTSSLKRRDLKWTSLYDENTIFLLQLMVVYALIGIEIVTVIAFRESKPDGDFSSLFFLLSMAPESFEPSLFHLIGGMIGGFHAGMLKTFSWQVSPDAKTYLKVTSRLALIPLAPFVFIGLIIAFMPGPGSFMFFHPLMPMSFITKVFFSLITAGIVFFLITRTSTQLRKWHPK